MCLYHKHYDKSIRNFNLPAKIAIKMSSPGAQKSRWATNKSQIVSLLWATPPRQSLTYAHAKSKRKFASWICLFSRTLLGTWLGWLPFVHIWKGGCFKSGFMSTYTPVRWQETCPLPRPLIPPWRLSHCRVHQIQIRI